jgi:hypothetical protein
MDRTTDTAQSVPLGLLPADLIGLGRKRLEVVLEAQSKLVDTLPALSREWMTYAEAERDLTAELLSKLTAARSIPESTAVYQEWLGRRVDMFAEKTRKLLADSQKLMDASARLFAIDLAGRKPETTAPAAARESH